MTTDAEAALDRLEEDGYLVVEGAISRAEAAHVQERVEHARRLGWEDGMNHLGNMWFDSLLWRDPDSFRPFVAHPSVRPLLAEAMGQQCQLRSLRCYTNPGPYEQEWHLDFYGYWDELRDSANARYACRPLAINTSFYLQDNDPGEACLRLVKGGHRKEPPHLAPFDRRRFDQWCDAEEHIDLHPKAGDCVVFFSHLPHRGFKENDGMTRSVLVCHYQVAPMHEGIWHITYPIAYAGTFPLVRDSVHAVGQKQGFVEGSISTRPYRGFTV